MADSEYVEANEYETDRVVITSPDFVKNIINSKIQVGEVLISPNDSVKKPAGHV